MKERKNQFIKGMPTLIILDTNVERMNKCETSLLSAAKDIGVNINVDKVSDPLHLERLQVYDKIPAVQAGEMFWSMNNNRAFNSQEARRLLALILG